MNNELLAQAMELLAEAEISYTANAHSYEPEIIAEMRSISDQLDKLYDKLKQSYAIIETKEILEQNIFSNKGVQRQPEKITVGELFERLGSAAFICPGGPLKHSSSYLDLKQIFSNRLSITVEEASKRISS